jgi:hypothetical protein
VFLSNCERIKVVMVIFSNIIPANKDRSCRESIPVLSMVEAYAFLTNFKDKILGGNYPIAFGSCLKGALL